MSEPDYLEIQGLWEDAGVELHIVTLHRFDDIHPKTGKNQGKTPLEAYKDKSFSHVNELAENYMGHNNIGIRTTNVVCVDLDMKKEGYDKVIGPKVMKMCVDSETFSQKTPGGRHYVFLIDDRMTRECQEWTPLNGHIGKDIDLKIGPNQFFVMAGSKNKKEMKYAIRDSNPPKKMPDKLFNLINKNCKFGKTKREVKRLKKKKYDELPPPEKYQNLTSQQELTDICDAFPNDFIDSYDKFMKIGTVIKNEFKGLTGDFDFFQQYCEKYSLYKERGYTRNGNYHAYVKFSGPLDKRYLYNQLKLLPGGMEKAHDILMRHTTEKLLENGTDMNLAALFLKINNNYTVCNKRMRRYLPSGHYVDACPETLECDISTTLNEYFETCLRKINVENQNPKNEEEALKNNKLMETFKKIKNSCQGSSKLQAIRRCVVGQLKKLNQDVRWDKNGRLFAFNNTVMNLETGTIKTSSRDDYISNFSDCKYENKDEALVEELNEIIKNIFPVEEEREYYLKILSTGMLGIPTPFFIIANGSGRNGKGLIHTLLIKLLGTYGYKCQPAVLQTEMTSGGNPAVANMNSKRFVLFSEPDLSKPLKTGTINSLTSCDGQIAGRALYSNVNIWENCGSYFIECNVKPGVSTEESDQANTRERIRDIPFRSSFLAESDRYGKASEDGGLILPCNPLYKTPEWQEKMALSFFHILLPRAMAFIKTQHIKTPESIIKRSNEYLDTNNIFLNWFKTNFQELTKDEVKLSKKEVTPNAIKLGTLYALFENSAAFESATNKDDLTKKQVYKKLSKHLGKGFYSGEKKKTCILPNLICGEQGVLIQKQRKYVIYPYIKKRIIDEEYDD